MGTLDKDLEKWKYYSVTRPVRFNGQKRVPSVCYALPRSTAKAIVDLASKGLVKLYAQRVRFLSGQPHVINAKDAPVLVEQELEFANRAEDSSSASEQLAAPPSV
jgi:hypothetical protein